MTESEFWNDLEFRLCREFAGQSDRSLQFLGCDGLAPDECLLDDPEPRIIGKAWIYGRGPSMWDFTLLPRQNSSRDEIDWAALLPPENVTRWLAVDIPRRRIEIEPSAAVPDLNPQVTESPRWSP